MPKAPLYRTGTDPYHVCTRSNNKEWFHLDPTDLWPIFCENLHRVNERYQSNIYTFVQMSNHIHMTLLTPNQNIDHFMRDFLTNTSKAIAKKTRRINHIFGGRYRWSVLRSPQEFAYVYKYVYRNPVVAGITQSPETYPYSSLFHLLQGNCPLPLVSSLGPHWKSIPRDTPTLLSWLRKPHPKESELLIGRALQHPFFRFPKGNDHRHHLKVLESEYLGPER